MKKQLVASLAAAMVLGVAGTSFAAANPFADVPAKHWSYDAVTTLAQAGIVDGYSDGKFQGDKMMSRYEMAQVVAKAMAHSDKADAAQKAAIDKLSVEFASELEGLNVRVSKIEKNASSVKITGEARVRYENTDFDKDATGVQGTSGMVIRTRLNATGNINEQWSYYGRLQAENNMRGNDGTNPDNNNVTMDNVFVKGSLLGTTATIGRFDYLPNDGLMLDSTLNGVNFAFGNVVKANVFYGKDNNSDIYGGAKGGAIADGSDMQVIGLALNYGVGKDTNLKGGYYQLKRNDNTAIFGTDDNAKVWELGFDTKLNADWKLKGAYGASDADDENKAYFVGLDYKGADKSKVGTFGAWINYRQLEANAAPRSTFDNRYAQGLQKSGGKGYEVGFNYTPMTNSVMSVKYVDVKSTTSGLPDRKTKYFQAQVEMFF